MADDAVAVVRRYLESLRRLDPEAMFAEVSDEDFVLELPLAPGACRSGWRPSRV